MSRRPVIGVSSRKIAFTHQNRPYPRHGVALQYLAATEAAGGLPIVFPLTQTEDVLTELLDLVDGLMLTGGDDIDPSWYDEEPHRRIGAIDPFRDQTEMTLAREAMRRGIPILGICRGQQVLNVVAGGSLYQDVEAQIGEQVLGHFQDMAEECPSHSVRVTAGSWLETITGENRVRVNSYHHQAVKDLAPGFMVTAVASDGVIEGISSTTHAFVHAVQWHPELQWRQRDFNFRLFEAHVAAAQAFAARRR